MRKPLAGGVTVPGVSKSEIDEMAAVERNFLHRGLIDHRADRDWTWCPLPEARVISMTSEVEATFNVKSCL